MKKGEGGGGFGASSKRGYNSAASSILSITVPKFTGIVLLDLIIINYIYVREHAYKIQYDLNLVFKMFHDGPQKEFHGPFGGYGPQVGNHCYRYLKKGAIFHPRQSHNSG